MQLVHSVAVKGMAHITGGGLSENIPRVLPPDVHAQILTNTWQQGPVFDWLAANGNIDIAEMRRTFNCGVGMVVFVDNADADTAISLLEDAGESAWHIGTVSSGGGEVEFV
jgi:phosphoribosylformylglycinamidine cyclo-ligase